VTTLAQKGSSIAGLWAVSLVLGACGGDGSDEWPNAVKTAAPVRTFAPMLHLHPNERLLPMSAGAFLARSALRWSDGECGEVTIAAARAGGASGAATIDASRLAGDRPYRHAARRIPGCRRAKVFSSSDYTRPYDPLRDNTITSHEGFFLDLDDRARSGSRAVSRDTSPPSVDVPVYYDRNTRQANGYTIVRLTYSMLYGMERLPGPSLGGLTAHEGSWRWIRVLLRGRPQAHEYVPVAVRYGPRSRYLPWRSVSKVGPLGRAATHPSIFIARASHVLYPKPGRYPRPVSTATRDLLLHDEARACPECIAWRSWRSLRYARAQSWYGYGGAWGESPAHVGLVTGLAPTPWGEGTKEQLLPPGKLQ
jgi:hypothetical protein